MIPKGETLVNQTEVAMIQQSDGGWFRYTIIFRGLEIQCVPTVQVLGTDVEVFQLARFQLMNGLSACDWSVLKASLIEKYPEMLDD